MMTSGSLEGDGCRNPFAGKNGHGVIVCLCAYVFFSTCAPIFKAGSKVKDTLRHSKYHLIDVGTLCFQFNGLISQGPEVRGHKSGSGQMSVSFKFPHCDLMLTGGKNLDSSLNFPSISICGSLYRLCGGSFWIKKGKKKKILLNASASINDGFKRAYRETGSKRKLFCHR